MTSKSLIPEKPGDATRKRPRPAIAATFVAGLAIGAGAALAVERLLDHSAHEIPLEAAPFQDDATSPDARPAISSPSPSLAGSPGPRTPTPTRGRATIRQPNVGTPAERRFAECKAALERGDFAQARALIDAAFAAGDPVGGLVDGLSPEELENWVRSHPGWEPNSAIRMLLQHGAAGLGPARASSIDLALDLLQRQVASHATLDRLNVLRALEADAARTLSILASAADESPDVGLSVASWLAEHGRKDEAVRRVFAETSRRAPTAAEVEWLTQYAPAAGVTAARDFAARRQDSPLALLALGKALERSGDKAAAFDAIAAALRVGVGTDFADPDALVRLDPQRASAVLTELYAGRDGGVGAHALIHALLRTGRAAEAGRELARLVSTVNYDYLTEATIVAPEATAIALASRFSDLAAVPSEQLGILAEYGSALRRAGRTDDAMRVLRVAADRSPRPAYALVELLRCDAASTRSYVESRLDAVAVDDPQRIRILGLLGRKDEAIATFERRRGGRVGSPSLWEALGAADPERAINGLSKIVADEQADGNSADDALIAWARVLSDAGRTAEARAVLARVTDQVHLRILVERAALR